ncbi:MAG: 4Fe-4S dicluster domain-containing protein [Chloroflexota bacterium]
MTVRFISRQGEESCDFTFTRQVRDKSQAGFDRCYQCQACSSGCPAAYAMDYSPDQIIRMVQLGLKGRVLGSSTIWLCASCQTCGTRCPNQVDVVRLMDTLREMVATEKGARADHALKFHLAFLHGIRKYGRVHELEMIIRYLLTSLDISPSRTPDDVLLGFKMFIRGKLTILPKRIKGLAGMRHIFAEAQAGSEHGNHKA